MDEIPAELRNPAKDREPHRMDWRDLSRVRELIRVKAACPWDEHVWVRFTHGSFTVAVLCSSCGRSVDEAIADLPLDA